MWFRFLLFGRENGVSRQNLSEVFSGRQDISVGLYLRVCTSLGVVVPSRLLRLIVGFLSVIICRLIHDLVINSLLKLILEN